jgi:2-(3-amino-3-carboxypropyl)histidine synthase
MDSLFIPAKSDIHVILPKSLIYLLKNKNVSLVTTIQHLHEMEHVKEQLEKSAAEVQIAGQILGCNASATTKVDMNTDIYLYIGSGRFHPLQVAYNTGKNVICMNPFSEEFSEITEDEISAYKKNKKIARTTFLSSDIIGILVSTKPGQNKLSSALSLKKKLHKKGKKAYIFLAETLNPNDFENYREIQCLINTACPRINEDHYPKKVIDIEDALAAFSG